MLSVSIALLALQFAQGKQGGFRGAQTAAKEGTVAAKEIRASLKESLEVALGIGAMHELEDRMHAVEATVFPTYQAMPKNQQGRLAPKGVRLLVQRFFSKAHGWTIQGLDVNVFGSSTSTEETAISQDKVPALMEAALEARQYGRGLSMNEVVALIVAIERLIMEDSVKILQEAYGMNGFSTAKALSKESILEVLTSFVGHYITEQRMNFTDASEHLAWKKQMMNQAVFASAVELVEDGVQNFKFSQKDAVFSESGYTFDTANQIAKSIKHKFGRWQDDQCLAMRSVLEQLDVNGTGRIPLQDFWAIDKAASFTFEESEDSLRSSGSLDESVPGKPSLRIANYVVAPGNCGRYASYYSVCCQNACDQIMEALEGKLQGPSTDSERLFALIGNISSSGDELEGPASPLFGLNGQYLRARLDAIADRTGGQVHLHSRSFAQWLHFAFPRECPHPITALTISQPAADQLQMDLLKAVAPEQWDVQVGYVPQWADEDSLPLLEPELLQKAAANDSLGSSNSSNSYIAMAAQFAALMALFGIAVRTGMDGFRASAAACGLSSDKPKASMTAKAD